MDSAATDDYVLLERVSTSNIKSATPDFGELCRYRDRRAHGNGFQMIHFDVGSDIKCAFRQGGRQGVRNAPVPWSPIIAGVEKTAGK